jgi:PKD repeat protein
MPEFIVILKKRRKKRPVPSFTYEADGLQVTFTDTSTKSPTRWLWDFGDGNTSTAQNPTHTYAEAGTYSVSLLAINAFGSKAPARQSVEVEAVTATFEELLASYNPIDWFKLDEASGNFANSGSNTAAATPVGTPTYQAGSLNDPNAGFKTAPNTAMNWTGTGEAIKSVIYLVRYAGQVVGSTAFFGAGGGTIRLRAAGGGVFINDLVGEQVGSTTSATLLINNWHLIVANMETGQIARIYMATTSSGGAMTEAGVGSAPMAGTANPTTPSVFLGNASEGQEITLGAFAALPTTLTLAQAQALAGTLPWS